MPQPLDPPAPVPTSAGVQLTLRSIVMGMLLGGVLSLSNLYTALKTGWSFGVSITAGILAFGIFAALVRVGIVRRHFGLLENNAMQSVASAAGYMTGGGTVAAIPALMMLTGEAMPGWQMFTWIAAIAFLGVVMAIPMKQQMIDVEQLRFPSGIAAAETLKALHGGAEGSGKARLLGLAGVVGASTAFLREAHASWMPFNLPARIALPASITLKGRPLADYTLYGDTSLLLVAGGAIMGFRAAWSLALGGIVCYGMLAPYYFARGVIDPHLGYKQIVAWSVWFGSAMILTSGLLAFAFQWRTVLTAVRSVGRAFGVSAGGVQVPMSWFFVGMAVLGPLVVFLQWFFFGIHVWMGVIAVVMSFFIAIVACRVTGETDTTPTGALGKITQVTYGVLDPGSVTTNLMTANVTGGIAIHSADLLTDLKSGYLLGADPRQQFWAQFLGVTAGACFVVPAYRLLIPTADVLGTDQWPAPAAQTWKGVAAMLANGFSSLHWTAQVALLVGGVLGMVLVLLERAFPAARAWIPSPAAFGLGFTTPAYNSISMFLGALIALILERRRPALAERTVIPVSSGILAGESVMGIVVAMLVVAGWLDG
jgi:uncharacterized oligopeptide transporter (OPT) family protein